MREMIDSHAHIFPDKIALKASQSIGAFYQMPVKYDGKVSTLFEIGARSGVSRFLVHSVATIPEQVKSINDFIAAEVKQHESRLIGFGALHPQMPQDALESEVKRIRSLGLCGIKLHPDFQKFCIDDPDVMPLYEIIGELPLLIHLGDFRFQYSNPSRLVNVLDNFPKLKVIGAHFGGWSQWNESENLLAGRDLYVDTCSSLYSLSKTAAKRLIEKFGPSRVLFGSDYPMWDCGDEIKILESLDLSESVLDGIFSKNLLTLLDIK